MAPEQEPALDPSVRRFLEHLATDRAASPYTQRNYRQALSEFSQWHRENIAGADWNKLQRDDFRAYLRFLGRQSISRAAIQLRFSALRSLYRFLIRQGAASESPIKDLSLPKAPKRVPKFLTSQQMEQLVAAPLKLLPKDTRSPRRAQLARDCRRDAAILETLYSGGLRISELCGLRARDINCEQELICVRGKGRKERLVPVGRPALDAIRSYWKMLPLEPAGEAPVFGSSRNPARSIPAREMQRRLKRYLAIAGLDPQLTPHKLRHSYATHMLDAGADLRSVQELLGHAHLSSTQVYTHVTTQRLKKAYDAAHPRA